jgi:hypothetical protein
MLAKKRQVLIVALFAAAVALALSAGANHQMAGAAEGKPRVLYITESKGFKHPVLPESERVMKELGEKHGFDLTISQEAEKAITTESLKNLDVIIFYTTGELPLSEGQKTAFLNFIKSGKAFIGIHSATDTFYKWPEYGEMINGYFDGHPWTQDTEVSIKVTDRTHPATRHLPESMRFKEEIYQFRDFSPERVKVLASLDTANTDMTKKGIKAAQFPLIWYRSYGRGRVFYTALGHRPDIWQSQWYQTMLVQAIKWSAGNLK